MDYIPDATDPGNLDKGLYCEYDGWNRLAHVRRGGRPVADYEYDGLGRRIVKRVYLKDTGVLTEVRHFYYSQGWQVLQERVAVDPEGATPWETRLDRQYVWGVRGPDDLILRDRDTKQTPNGVPNERQYALADGNGNIISLYDVQHEYSAVPAKRLVERMEYDAYGRPRFMDKDFGSLSESGKHWSVLYGGYYYDAETGLYHVRNRMYHPLYGRWLQTDPSGFDDSYNRYQYCLSNPLTYVDPTGLAAGAPGFWESMIPVWGSGRAAINDFQTGHWGWGIFNTVMAISDVFLLKSLVTAPFKLGGKLLFRQAVKEAGEQVGKEALEQGAKEVGEQLAKDIAIGAGEQLAKDAPVSDLARRMIGYASSAEFKANAALADFSERQIAQLAGRLAEYASAGMIRRTISTVSTTTADAIRISWLGGKRTMFHEMTHMLQEIAQPGLLAMEKRLGYTAIVSMERAAGIVQTGAKGLWATTVIPHAAATQAYANVASIAWWGISSYGLRNIEYRIRRKMGGRRRWTTAT